MSANDVLVDEMSGRLLREATMTRDPRTLTPEQLATLTATVLEIAVRLSALRDELRIFADEAHDLAVAIDTSIKTIIDSPSA
jgi:hypothetical protein